MNIDKSYFKGTINNDNGAGEVYMLLANGAQWTNESKGDFNYHNSSLNQLAGGEADAKAGNIFQKDSGSLTIDKYSGNTTVKQLKTTQQAILLSRVQQQAPL